MSFRFDGAITALVTPFVRGEVDHRSFRRLVVEQLDQGIEGLVVNGTTGESPTLNFSEVRQLVEIAREVSGGAIPVIVGTGSNSTLDSIEMTRAAKDWGADGALVVVPYYNKPPQRGLIQHFSQIADSVDLPLLLYNVPSRTITSLGIEAIVELATHPRIVGLKEASGDLQLMDQMKTRVPKDFTLLSGDDSSAVEFCLRGGSGVISVVANLIPENMSSMIGRARNGQASVREEYKKYGELLRVLYLESNPIPVKAALFMRGTIDSMEMRLPLVELSEEYKLEVEKALESLQLIGGD